MITVVNVIPLALSGESNQDSEPNIAVNPANANEVAITAFTPDPMGGPNAPVFVSSNGGNSWVLNAIVPSQLGNATGDITMRFGTAGNRFYAGILRRPGNLRLNILRAASFSAAGTMTVLVDRTSVDQPYLQAMTVPSGPQAGQDRVYVGLNDFAVPTPNRRTATVDMSQNAGAASPTFVSARIETRSTGTANQNGPQVRPAVHSDGTVYAVFYGWRAFGTGNLVTSDVVVVRDDNWGQGTTPFTALTDPSDGRAGRIIATGIQFTFGGTLGNDRLGGDLSIAVDPNNSSTVYIAFCDTQAGAYTLHVRRSTDRGVTWSADLKTLANTKNPALAINSAGKVALAYQRVTGSGTAQRWETHLELTTTGFTTTTDNVLATTPANTPAVQFLPYIGDYLHMMAVGTTFFGVFSANNTPDNANFPNGVTYQRNANFTTHQLLAVDNRTVVPASIDPFFFRHTDFAITSITRLTPITRFTKLTSLTPLTNLTLLTRLTRLTSLTRLTTLTRLTNLTPLTSLTRLTLLTRLTRLTLPPVFTSPPGPRPGPGPDPAPFIRFRNSLFAPEDLAISRFEELEGVASELEAIGITGLHQLVVADWASLAADLGYPVEDASRLVALAQALLRNASG